MRNSLSRPAIPAAAVQGRWIGNGWNGPGPAKPNASFAKRAMGIHVSIANSNVQPAYLETNLQVTDQAVSASSANVEGYAPYFQPSAWQQTGNGTGILFPGGYITDSTDNFTLDGSTSAGFAIAVQDASGAVVSNLLDTTLTGSTITSLTGTFNLVAPGPITPWAFEGGFGTGAFTATAIQPVNGAYSGTLQTSGSATDLVTFNITQNNLSITLNGSASISGNAPHHTHHASALGDRRGILGHWDVHERKRLSHILNRRSHPPGRQLHRYRHQRR